MKICRQLRVASGCCLSISGSRQRCKMLLPWILPETTRGSVVFRDTSLQSITCSAQAGGWSTWLGHLAAIVSLLLRSEFLNTRQILPNVSSSRFTSPVFADLSAQLVYSASSDFNLHLQRKEYRAHVTKHFRLRDQILNAAALVLCKA